MSSRARDKRDRATGKGGKVHREAVAGPEGVDFKPPLRPHRGVFIVLCIVLAVWVGVLLVMYFKTVYPQRHGAAGKGFSLDAQRMRVDFR